MTANYTNRKTVIITFKPKDQRSTQDDKQAIANGILSTPIDFKTAKSFSQHPGTFGAGGSADDVGYDVNRYETPILVANLYDDDIQALRDSEDVLDVEDDGPMYAIDLDLDPNLVEQAQIVPSGLEQIKATSAWSSSQGEGISVFVADTGIDSDHPDLVPNLKPGKSFVASETTTEDFQGHGTHVAGTIAAAFNRRGVVGVAPHADLIPLKVLAKDGSGQWSALIAALDWVMDQEGARIVNMSLGGPTAPQALQRMCNNAYSAGVLLVAAAGNAGPDEDSVGLPARCPSVIAVSAIDASNRIARASSRGPQVELCAPGVEVLSTTRDGALGKLSGTSMACPHVAGAAALAWGAHRSCNNRQIRWLLTNFADRVGDAEPSKYGRGRVNANDAAFFLGPVPE